MNRFVIIILSAIIFFVGCEANFDPSESGTTQESASTVVSFSRETTRIWRAFTVVL